MEKTLLRGLSLLGLLLFLPLFLFTFADPQLIEKSGKSFVEWKLQSEVNNKIDAIQLPKTTSLENLLGTKTQALRTKADQNIEKIKQQLKADAPALLANQLAKLHNLDCECRKKWEQSIKRSMQSRLTSLESTKNKLIEFTHVKYMEIVHKLTLDVRIFLAANSIVFLFLLIASFLKPKAIKHLFLPSALMLLSTGICSYFYLFEQNWFYTIIYNNYTGLAYVGYLGLVFAILCDIVFNKARVTTRVINAVASALGSAVSVVSC
jgi:hypothetical protein